MRTAKYHDYTLLRIVLFIILIVLGIFIYMNFIKAPLEHVAADDAWVTVEEATCTEDGTKCKVCTDCGEKFDFTTIPATGHSIDNKEIITKQPDCVNTGMSYKACKDCGEKMEFITIPAIGHTPEKDQIVDVEPTCTEEGHAHIACSVCDAVVKNIVLDPLGHVAEEGVVVTVPAECEKDGQTYKVCIVCSEQFDHVAIPATGHLPENAEDRVDTPATCTVDGLGYKHCLACGVDYDYVAIPATGHPAEQVENIHVPASCLDEGVDFKYCLLCSTEFDEQIIPANGHTPAAETIVDLAPTCTEIGYGHKLCEVCGLVAEDVEIAALGHTEADVVIENVVHTLTEGASHDEVVYCTVCNEQLSRDRVKADHTTITINTVSLEPDCVNTGLEIEEVFCYACDCNIHVEYITLPAKGHSFDWKIIDTDGYLNLKVLGECTVCGYVCDPDLDAEYSYDPIVKSENQSVDPTCICGYDRYVTVVYHNGVAVASIHFDEVLAPIYNHRITVWDEDENPVGTIDINEVVQYDENGRAYFNISTPGIELRVEQIGDETYTEAVARIWAEGNGFAEGLYKCAVCGRWVTVTVYNDLA